jgi:predicted RNA-binding Zn-ribbon protein involved in translation (DUF1610 family)
MNNVLKSSGIILGEDNRPKVVCPHCRQIIIMDIKLFLDDVSKVVESSCPKCGGKLYTALLIMTNSNLNHLRKMIEMCITVINPGNKLYRG